MKVDHIIIGAGRSGTTSLVEYLKQHPSINFSSIKEVTYFSVNDHFKRGASFFHSFFKEKDDTIVSTSDTYLLMDKEAPKRVFEYNPKMKITVILREPIARTYSNYQYSVNQGYINQETTLIESQKKEESVLQSGDIIDQNNHCSFYGSLYNIHLANWAEYFPREQLHICKTSELRKDPASLMNEIFDFLGIEKKEVHVIKDLNRASGVKNKTLNRFLVERDHWLRKLISKPLQISVLRNIVLNSNVVERIKESNREELSYMPMSEGERKFCQDYFEEDLKKLNANFGVKFDT